MLDRLNMRLALEVTNSEIPKKYVDNIIEKMNEKYNKNKVPVTLIIDNLNSSHSDILELLEYLINGLKSIKVIFVEKTSETQSLINFGPGISTETYKIKELKLENILNILV